MAGSSSGRTWAAAVPSAAARASIRCIVVPLARWSDRLLALRFGARARVPPTVCCKLAPFWSFQPSSSVCSLVPCKYRSRTAQWGNDSYRGPHMGACTKAALATHAAAATAHPSAARRTSLPSPAVTGRRGRGAYDASSRPVVHYRLMAAWAKERDLPPSVTLDELSVTEGGPRGGPVRRGRPMPRTRSWLVEQPARNRRHRRGCSVFPCPS